MLVPVSIPSDYLHLRAEGDIVDVIGSTSFLRGSKLATSRGGHDEGYFVAWTWDGDQLIVESEPCGFAPVYYFATADEIVVSTNPLEVLRRSRAFELDWSAIAVFLSLGFFLGDDTPWRHIRAVPASGHVAWRPGRGVSVGNDALDIHAPCSDRNAAIATYSALFTKAVGRRLSDRHPICVPLSGGRDSRHILFELVTRGVRPDLCITAHHFAERNDEDASIASTLCEGLGIKHSTVRQPMFRIGRDRLKNELTGFGTDEHTWALPILDRLRTSGIHLVFDGIGGDVMSAGLFLNPKHLALYLAGDLDELATALLRSWGPGPTVLEEFLTDEARAVLSWDVAHRRLLRELEVFRDHINPLTAFYFWNRTRREISLYSFTMLSSVGVPVTPYLDRDLMAFLLGLPPEMVIDKSFHDEVIRQTYPRWNDIPYESKDAIRSPGSYWVRLGMEAGFRFARGADASILRNRALAWRCVKSGVRGTERAFWFAPLRLLWLQQLVSKTAVLGSSVTSIGKHTTHP